MVMNPTGRGDGWLETERDEDEEEEEEEEGEEETAHHAPRQ